MVNLHVLYDFRLIYIVGNNYTREAPQLSNGIRRPTADACNLLYKVSVVNKYRKVVTYFMS